MTPHSARPERAETCPAITLRRLLGNRSLPEERWYACRAMSLLCATDQRERRRSRVPPSRGRCTVFVRLPLLVACSCHPEPVMDLEPAPARAPSSAELEQAREVRLFFAHQSVGQNILNGVAQLSAPRLEPTPLLSLHPNEPLPGWVDMAVGQNGDPRGKIDAFVAAFAKHPTFHPDLALLKFCFVDFQPETDVDQLFHHYEHALRELEARHPETVFGHVTVPLTVYPTELKWRVFRLLCRGRGPFECPGAAGAGNGLRTLCSEHQTLGGTAGVGRRRRYRSVRL